MRTVTEVVGDKYLEMINQADFIFSIGDPGTQSYNSFLSSNLPVLNFYPSTSPKVTFDLKWIEERQRNSFLCFAGNGFICKGVDLVLEAFLKDQTKELHICGPNSESIFFEHYGEQIKNAPNITYHGFIEPGGELFNSLAARCSYVVFHSASEGCCTSVATAMRAGLVPIINSWTGINVEGIGIQLAEEGDIIQTIKDETDKASLINTMDYSTMVTNTLRKAQKFSQDSFTQSYSAALDYVIAS
jgi:glycosyltransferase involved in cell wall biosynthesis